MAARILIADDDAEFRLCLHDRFRAKGYDVCEASNSSEVLRTLKKKGIDLVILDMQLGDEDGIALLDKINNIGERLEVIMVTGYGSVENAVTALQQGACDFVSKSCAPSDLDARITKALKLLHLKLEREDKRQTTTILGSSQHIQNSIELADKLAKADVSVFLTGETGTGKSVFAHHIHTKSPRAGEPFVTVNCANLSAQLLEDELFGHEPGAFTDAKKQRRGKVALAEKGTLFLDEIGELPFELQPKLLRFLEERTYYRVGGEHECQADIRIIAATNKNLEHEIKEGRFREDLFYRLNVIPISLPALRERPEDIPNLIYFYFNESATGIDKRQFSVTEEALHLLCRYPWPGNIREVRNVVERIKILSSHREIGIEDLPPEFRNPSQKQPSRAFHQKTYKENMQETQREIILDALIRTNWHQTKAAENLQMDRSRLITIMKKHQLSRENIKETSSFA